MKCGPIRLAVILGPVANLRHVLKRVAVVTVFSKLPFVHIIISLLKSFVFQTEGSIVGLLWDRVETMGNSFPLLMISPVNPSLPVMD